MEAGIFNDSVGEDDYSSEEDCTLDFLDLASSPLDNVDVFNRVTDDLLDGSIQVYFTEALKYVTLGPKKSNGKSGGSQEWSDSAALVFQWLHDDKEVKIIQEIWVSDSACGGDSRIMNSLWDTHTMRPFFSGIETFSWLSPNISVRTIEAVAPGVKNLSLVWDGCTRAVLEAWETDLKSHRLRELEALVIVTSAHGHAYQSSSNDLLLQLKTALAGERTIKIEWMAETAVKDAPECQEPSEVFGQVEPGTDEKAGMGEWFQGMHSFDEMHAIHDKEFLTSGLGGNIKVAILDTGVDAGHDMLKSCIYRRKSFLPGTHDFIDPVGHGTHLAGLVHQVAPNAKLFIGRIFDGSKFKQEHAAEGIRWAIQQRVDIISCSWGFASWGRELREAVGEAIREGILVFASASNSGLNEKKPPYPARRSGVYSIGACDSFGHAADFTSPDANFLLPGKNITSSYPRYLTQISEKGKKCLSGCSMATAIAAGLAARILEFAEICKLDTEELRMNEGMKDIFKNFMRDQKYVFPWNKIPIGKHDPVEWMRWRFFADMHLEG